jgi:hypothetical protein
MLRRKAAEMQQENLVRSMITGWKRRHAVRRDPDRPITIL